VKRPWYINKYVPLAVTGGLTLGFLGASIGTGIEAIHWHRTFVDPSTNAADRAHAQSRGRLFADVNDGMVAGAAVFAVATAAVYYFIWMRHPHETSNVSVAPWVQSATGGLAVAGSF
jgi:transcription elongation factor